MGRSVVCARVSLHNRRADAGAAGVPVRAGLLWPRGPRPRIARRGATLRLQLGLGLRQVVPRCPRPRPRRRGAVEHGRPAPTVEAGQGRSRPWWEGNRNGRIRGRGRESVRFTTGAIRVDHQGHVVLPRIGRVRSQEPTTAPPVRVDAGVCNLAVRSTGGGRNREEAKADLRRHARVARIRQDVPRRLTALLARRPHPNGDVHYDHHRARRGRASPSDRGGRGPGSGLSKVVLQGIYFRFKIRSQILHPLVTRQNRRSDPRRFASVPASRFPEVCPAAPGLTSPPRAF